MHIPRMLTRSVLLGTLIVCLTAPSLAAEAEYCFTRSDFSGESGIVITAVPSPQHGVLRCGERTIVSGDVLTVQMLDSLRFLGSDSEQDAEAVICYLPVSGCSVQTEQTVRLELMAKKKNQKK